MTRRIASMLSLVLLVGCGARTAVDVDDPAHPDAARRDGGMDAAVDSGADSGPDSATDSGHDAGCTPIEDGCGDEEVCGNGGDDDCDGRVDDGCPCAPGDVQGCFAGPPGRRGVGACQDGSQVCIGAGTWGACEGGILPNPDECTGRDDLCDGCSDERICAIDCPSPGDLRVPVGTPFSPYVLRGREFYAGPAAAWRWTVSGGPCDELAPRLESFELTGGGRENATLTPRLSGDYRVTLRVTTPGGDVLECSWVVHVAGPGLRVEMCYPESEMLDLDLFLHRPDDRTEWYRRGGTAFDAIPEAACGWGNCEASIRATAHPITGAPVTRADWGYADTPLEGCENGPQGPAWRGLGACSNPRLDIDNNLSEGIGVPENINVDNPRNGQTFRVMVQNFSGDRARPLVNVYCGGRRVATYGRAPDTVPAFTGLRGDRGIGVMWRVADVTVRVDSATGETLGCEVSQLHPPGTMSGYDVTNEDPRY